MLDQRLRTEAGTPWVGAAYEHKQMRKMVVTLALLVLSLTLVLVRDHKFWFGADETATVDESVVTPAPRAVTAAATPVVPAKKSVATTVPAAANARPTLPAVKVDITTQAQRTGPATIHSVKIQSAPSHAPQSAIAAKEETPWSPVTNAAEHVRIVDQAYAPRQPLDASYPLLAQQMKVEGSVVMQVIIGADGVIQNMRILSGPPILATAAREAVRNWRFKPYLQNGQPVETSATVTVNLTIKVLDNSVQAVNTQTSKVKPQS